MRYIVVSLALLLFACTPARTPTPTSPPVRYVPPIDDDWLDRWEATRSADRDAIDDMRQKTMEAQRIESLIRDRHWEETVAAEVAAMPPPHNRQSIPESGNGSQVSPLTGCPNGCFAATPPACLIKGNISFDNKEKIYHMPGQKYYDATVIDPKYDERWFCTEDEAIANGWRKSKE